MGGQKLRGAASRRVVVSASLRLGVRSDRDEWDSLPGEFPSLRAPDETSSSLVGWKLRPRIWVTPFEAKALPSPPAIGWHRLSRTNRGRRVSLRTHSPSALLLPRPPAFAWVLPRLLCLGCPLSAASLFLPESSSPSPSETPVRSSLLPWRRLAPAAGRSSSVLPRGKRRLLLLLCLLLILMLWVPPGQGRHPRRFLLGSSSSVRWWPLASHWHPPPNTRTKPSRSLSLKTRGLSRRVCPPPSPPSIARHHLPEGATWLCGLDHRHRHRHRRHRRLHSIEQFHLSPTDSSVCHHLIDRLSETPVRRSFPDSLHHIRLPTDTPISNPTTLTTSFRLGWGSCPSTDVSRHPQRPRTRNHFSFLSVRID